jgi:transglutaminase-like putative cysteine protease
MIKNLSKYLLPSDIINFDNILVSKKADELRAGLKSEDEIIKKCFEFVRDEIDHCIDHDKNPVTLKASEALFHKSGFCYSKSHLLAALLRANNIPTGLCYQRLLLDESNKNVFCLHGLCAVYLEKHGWYRIDPRGNNKVVSAEFTPPVEKLPFGTYNPGEADFKEVWPEPLPVIVEFLSKHSDYKESLVYLPDIEIV